MSAPSSTPSQFMSPARVCSQPIHCAMRETATVPAVANTPQTASEAGIVPGPGPSGSNSTISSTTEPVMPPPTLDHDDPFQRAILLVPAKPPANVKLPPAYSAGRPGPAPSSSKTLKACTALFTVLLSDDQLLPFQRPMPATMTPPAMLNAPPT